MDQPVQVHVQLDIAPTAEAITVVADALQVNTATAAGGSTLGRRQIANFPFNGRNFVQPRTRLPNVAQTASRYQLQGIQPARDGFSVNALRAQSKYFLLDGVSNLNPNFNGYVITPPRDAPDRFKITAGTYSAENDISAVSALNAIARGGRHR